MLFLFCSLILTLLARILVFSRITAGSASRFSILKAASGFLRNEREKRSSSSKSVSFLFFFFCCGKYFFRIFFRNFVVFIHGLSNTARRLPLAAMAKRGAPWTQKQRSSAMRLPAHVVPFSSHGRTVRKACMRRAALMKLDRVVSFRLFQNSEERKGTVSLNFSC